MRPGICTRGTTLAPTDCRHRWAHPLGTGAPLCLHHWRAARRKHRLSRRPRHTLGSQAWMGWRPGTDGGPQPRRSEPPPPPAQRTRTTRCRQCCARCITCGVWIRGTTRTTADRHCSPLNWAPQCLHRRQRAARRKRRPRRRSHPTHRLWATPPAQRRTRERDRVRSDACPWKGARR